MRPPAEADSSSCVDGFRPYRVTNVILLSALVAVAAVLMAGHVVDDARVAFPLFGELNAETCVFQRTHGIECASCGITRSVVALFDGDFQRSREFHPAGIAVALFLLLQIGLRAVFSTERFAPYWKWDVWLTTATILIGFGWFIVRIPNPV